MSDIDSVQQAHAQLEQWRSDLAKCLEWLDAEISAGSNGAHSNKALPLLVQNIALIRPWFRGLMNDLPAKAPDNISVTRLPYQESSEHRLNLWGQCVSHRDPAKGILNRETDGI